MRAPAGIAKIPSKLDGATETPTSSLTRSEPPARTMKFEELPGNVARMRYRMVRLGRSNTASPVPVFENGKVFADDSASVELTLQETPLEFVIETVPPAGTMYVPA